MMKMRRSLARYVLTIPILFAGGFLMHEASLGQGTPAAPAAAAQAAPGGAPQATRALAQADMVPVFEYAEQISRLVQYGKIDELSKLNLPSAGNSKLSLLRDWSSGYVSTLQKQEQEREKQYNEQVAKAQEYLTNNRIESAMEPLVKAFRIAKEPEAFLKLDWVKTATARANAKALELEKSGNWLESLQLFSDLNTLYEIDCTYKPDMQRLARRTRLIAMYTPRTLYEMRKAILDREAEENKSTTRPATASADIPDNFPKWQDHVEKITIDMASDAIERSVQDWVETTDYEQLLRGGVEALRLFLTTPELAKEFPALADPAARNAYNEALNGALASLNVPRINAATVGRVIRGLISASESSIKLPSEVVLMEFTDGAMERLDPFTSAIWPHELDEFEKNTRGSFGGVGIQISLEREDVKPEEAALKKIDPGQETKPDINANQKVDSKYRLVVITPLEETPAHKAGIEAGDVITAINGKSTVGISIDEAVHSIMGTPGSTVTLRIKRGEDEKDYALRRDVISVASVKGFQRDPADPTRSRWDFMLDPETRIGYIRVTGFQEKTADDLRLAIEDLKKKGMRGLILDFRFNPGGLLNAAVEMCDMFLEEGTIVSTSGRSQRARNQPWRAHADTIVSRNTPIVVLVNEYSASASEIFAGAMKDLRRAMIVGHRTFGKGSVQNLLPIGTGRRPDGSPQAMMKLTMAYYYLPNNESLHRKDKSTTWGVDPDVTIDLTPEQLATLLKKLRDNDIIPSASKLRASATAPAATPQANVPDTQLETALLMMRLQLVQSGV